MISTRQWLTPASGVPTIGRSAPFKWPPRAGRDSNVIKQDLIQRVVDRTGLPRTRAEQAVEEILKGMKKALTNGERIELRGFGVFTVKPRKTGIGRNPRTGTEVDIEPGRAVRFKPGKDLQVLDKSTD